MDLQAHQDSIQKNNQYWVAIGASAGGLDALRAFVRNLPHRPDTVYIIAQHLSPSHLSSLPDILSRETNLTVVSATNQPQVDPDTIYITPENSDIEVAGDGLKLLPPDKSAGKPKPSVNRLFRSLAAQKGSNAIGIILSGTGTDGAEGIRDIRTYGGITLAQDTDTAEYDGMPRAAMQTGCVDLVLSPTRMGTEFAAILEHRFQPVEDGTTNLEPSSFFELIQLVQENRDIDFSQYKAATLHRRVWKRMTSQGINSLDHYVNLVRKSQAEADALCRDFLISVTSFFRDQVEFVALRTQLAHRLNTQDPREPFRIWVPGCATGEEAYSIAMLVADCCGGIEGIARRRVEIMATDVDTIALESAQRGVYPAAALRSVPKEFIPRYFKSRQTGYDIHPLIKDHVTFAYHNIAEAPPLSRLDLISCRNLLIYFQNELQAQVLSHFHDAMKPSGLLFLGKSETVSAKEALFRAVEEKSHIYLPRHAATKETADLLGSISRDADQVEEQNAQRLAPTTAGDAHERAAIGLESIAMARFESLARALGPNGLLIDADYQLRKAFGEIAPYLKPASDIMSFGLTSLVKEPFGSEIRAAIPVVLRSGESWQGVRHRDDANPDWSHQATVYPADGGPNGEAYVLAIIRAQQDSGVDHSAAPDAGEAALIERNQALTQELRAAEDAVRKLTFELERSDDLLRDLKGALQASNEELQSTNEELETSNEELQSTNEELATVNEELQNSASELALANSNLKAILSNINTPLIVVDAGLNILHMSMASEALFNVDKAAKRMHLSLLVSKGQFLDLVSSTHKVMQTQKPYLQEINMAGLNAIVSIVPNVVDTVGANGGEANGAIILISDNTQEVLKARNELQLIFDHLPQAIFARDQDGRILKSNKSGRRLINAQQDDITGRLFYDFMAPDQAEGVKARDVDFFRSGDAQSTQTDRFVYHNGDERWIRLSRVRSVSQDGDPILYAIGEDLTSEYNTLEALKLSEERQDLAVQAANIGLWDWGFEKDVLWVSDRFKEMIGLAPDASDSTIDHLFDRLHPEDKDRVVRQFRLQKNSHDVFTVIFRVEHGNGTYIWLEARGQAARDTTGRPVRLIGSIEDVSERNKHIWALQESSAQLQQAAKLSGLGYWRIDMVNGTLFWSDEIYKIHGLDSATFKPTTESALNFYHPDDLHDVTALVERAIAANEPFEFEARLVRPNGEIRYVKSTGEAVAPTGQQAIAIFGVFRDVTDEHLREATMLKTLDELSKSNEELGRFSFVCSHDMKEPVRLINSMCELLLDEDIKNDEAERDDLISRISASTSRLAGIIDSLLAYSRIDGKIESVDVDLNKCLDDCLEAISLLVERSDAEVTWEGLPTVTGARVHFEQLFQNLISNAIKFSDKEHPLVAVSAVETPQACQITVEDNGPGIPESARDEVFAVFKRLQLRNEVEGTGLGLSICQRIVTQYGGNITIEDSKALGGAAFKITLPKTSDANP